MSRRPIKGENYELVRRQEQLGFRGPTCLAGRSTTLGMFSMRSEQTSHETNSMTLRREPTYAMTTFARDWSIQPGSHQNIEISVVVGGSGVFHCGGAGHAIARGSIVCIGSGVEHHYASGPGIRFCILESDALGDSAWDLFETLLEGSEFRILSFSNLDLEQYEILFQSFLRLTSSHNKYQRHFIRLWIELLLVHILRTANRPTRKLLPDVAEYIRLNLQSELSVEDLASQSGMSLSSFRSAFKSLYGLTPKQFQQQKQLEELQWLLRSTDRPLKELAESVGLANSNYLSTWFQEKMGMSPSQWRRWQQGLGKDPLL